MLTVAAVLLAVLVLPSPWGALAVAAAAVVDVAETVVLVRRSRRRRSPVGAEALVGRVATATGRLDPEGRVRLDGELWSARLEGAAAVDPGEAVEVCGVDGLLLVVRRAPLA